MSDVVVIADRILYALLFPLVTWMSMNLSSIWEISDVSHSVEHFSYLFYASDSQFLQGQSYKSWEVFSLAASQQV